MQVQAQVMVQHVVEQAQPEMRVRVQPGYCMH
jgi:hypothetical protein